MAREVEGEHRESMVGEPRRQRAPAIEVASLVVDEQSPAVCVTRALAAQDDLVGARKLDWDQLPRSLPIGGQRLLQQLDAELNVTLEGLGRRTQISCFQRRQ